MSMRKLTPCEFNIDTACVELRYADGEALSLYTSGVADHPQRKFVFAHEHLKKHG